VVNSLGSWLYLDNMETGTLSLKLYFSYGQFMVYDESVRLPGCAWTKRHSSQGFARRESVVNFGTLLEFGEAAVTVRNGPYEVADKYVRVIAVPFLVVSGTVHIEGPEEMNVQRRIDMGPGHYRLIAAQEIKGEEEEAIDLFFEPLNQPLVQSAILMADDDLNPQMPLLETAGIAGEE
jgi:hypothetical protein